MDIFLLDIPADETYGVGAKNILPLIIMAVFAIGIIAAIFYWKRNKN